MEQLRVRKRIQAPEDQHPISAPGVTQFDRVTARRKTQPTRRGLVGRPNTVPITHPDEARARRRRAQERVAKRQADQRVQHELRELQETHDLDDVDDDVEALTTLFEWRALEHNHRPKSQRWYIALAASVAVVSAGFAVTGNIIAAITIAFAGGLTYYIAQQEPKVIRYRLMTDGVAFNNTMYHYRELEAFNIVYNPQQTKTVLLRSKRTFAPLLHMELGDTDPVAVRDLLLEFVEEDQDLLEPLVDIYARRLGF